MEAKGRACLLLGQKTPEARREERFMGAWHFGSRPDICPSKRTHAKSLSIRGKSLLERIDFTRANSTIFVVNVLFCDDDVSYGIGNGWNGARENVEGKNGMFSLFTDIWLGLFVEKF